MERLSSTSPIPAGSAYISSHSLEGKNTINCFVRDVILKKLEFDSSSKLMFLTFFLLKILSFRNVSIKAIAALEMVKR